MTRADKSAVIGINLTRTGGENEKGTGSRVGAGEEWMWSGAPCGRLWEGSTKPWLCVGQEERNDGIPVPQTGFPRGAPLHSAPPLPLREARSVSQVDAY